MHAAGSNGSSFQAAGFDRYAQEFGFVCFYPDARGGNWDVFTPRAEGNHDVEFIRTLIESARTRFELPSQRVFITGHSNGAFMCYRLALDIPQSFAAIAPVAGLMPITQLPTVQTSKNNPAVLHVHAKDDNVVFVGGHGWGSKTTPAIFNFFLSQIDPRRSPTLLD